MKNGFRIWHRNWRSRYGYELDIVAFKDNLIHVVEVKTRTDNVFQEPYTALNNKKLRRVQIGAGIYKNAQEAFATLQRLSVIEPIEQDREACKDAYERWKALLKKALS